MRYQDYTGPWPWNNFQPREVACKHCGELWEGDDMPEWFSEAMDALQELRDEWREPIVINSGHRCVLHNLRTPGASRNSQHMIRIAFDCRCPREKQGMFAAAAKSCGFTTAVPYPTRGFVHLDMGPARTWQGE